MEEYVLLNLCDPENLHLDPRYNDESLWKIEQCLKNNEIVKAELKRDLNVKFWDPKTWEKSYSHDEWLELFNPDKEPFFHYHSIYVMPKFHKLKLASLPVMLNNGLVGRVYGIAFYNGAWLEQDQITNSVLLGFPLKNGLIAPVELGDIIENEQFSITNVRIFKE